MMADELKPCPFCNASGENLGLLCDPAEGLDNSGPSRRVQCYGCNIEAPFYDTKAEAIAAWNTRPAPKADSALVGELREDFDLAHALIQEAKGAADGPEGGLVTNHLDAAEGHLDTIEAHLAALSDRDVVLEEAAKDKERLDWLQSEMFDVRWVSGAGDQMCSPSDEVGVRIVSHWMADPQERVEAENWNEDLRAVIDEARALKGGVDE